MPVLIQHSNKIEQITHKTGWYRNERIYLIPVALTPAIAFCDTPMLIKRTVVVLISSLVTFSGAFSQNPLPPYIVSSIAELPVHPF